MDKYTLADYAKLTFVEIGARTKKTTVIALDSGGICAYFAYISGAAAILESLEKSDRRKCQRYAPSLCAFFAEFYRPPDLRFHFPAEYYQARPRAAHLPARRKDKNETAPVFRGG